VIFNFFLGNLPAERLKKAGDLVRPVQCGLVENGHRVIGYGLGLLPAPAVNLLVEYFPDDDFAARLVDMKSAAGGRLLLGLLCADDLDDREVMDGRRRANLERVSQAADFVWSLLPQVAAYDAMAKAGRAVHLPLGFTPRLLNRTAGSAGDLRDIDVVIEGSETAHRRGILQSLTRAGLKCFMTGSRPLPGFATADLARRAKVFLDARRHPAERFCEARRISKGLHNGTVVLTEVTPSRIESGLERFAACYDTAVLIDHCVAAVRSGMAAGLGAAALAKFRAESSMRDNVAAALKLPVFEGLGR
jgi:hypothetical protein